MPESSRDYFDEAVTDLEKLTEDYYKHLARELAGSLYNTPLLWGNTTHLTGTRALRHLGSLWQDGDVVPATATAKFAKPTYLGAVEGGAVIDTVCKELTSPDILTSLSPAASNYAKLLVEAEVRPDLAPLINKMKVVLELRATLAAEGVSAQDKLQQFDKLLTQNDKQLAETRNTAGHKFVVAALLILFPLGLLLSFSHYMNGPGKSWGFLWTEGEKMARAAHETVAEAKSIQRFAEKNRPMMFFKKDVVPANITVLPSAPHAASTVENNHETAEGSQPGSTKDYTYPHYT